MKIFIVCLALAVLVTALEELNYWHVHRVVKRRHASGDTGCGVRKTWYGWRVQEYGECDQ